MGSKSAFSKVIGLGGIGSGVLYQLNGNQDLGRNESRMAHVLPTRDFCKQHIILHYLTVLLKDMQAQVKILPVGGVGNDDAGLLVKGLMKQAGMDVKYVSVIKNAPTLFSVCFLYPDKSGGNITENRSASSKITPAFVRRVKTEFRQRAGRCLVLAAPEVPLGARMQLLALGSEHKAFNVASFVGGEMRDLRRGKRLKLIDLLAVNLDEAAQFGAVSRKKDPERIVRAFIVRVTRENPFIKLSITDGARGSYSYENDDLHFLPSLKVPVKSTAGAGDAFLSGLILGMARGLPFHGKGPATCARLARLISAMSVTSADTIHFGINLATLKTFAKKHDEMEVVKSLHGKINLWFRKTPNPRKLNGNQATPAANLRLCP